MLPCLLLCGLCGLPPVTREQGPVTVYEKDELLRLIYSEQIIATLTNDAIMRADKSASAKGILHLSRGAKVEVLKDRGEQWYFVRCVLSDKQGWLLADDISIPPDTPTDMSRPPAHALESYADMMGFSSKTGFLVIVDTPRQQAYVFSGAKNKWIHLRTLDISGGRNVSPTLKGEFEISDRGLWFYSNRLGSGGKHWVRFHGDYLFHSVAMDKNQNVIDGTIGTKASNGCVRLCVEDAEWLYNNVPDGTRVVVY